MYETKHFKLAGNCNCVELCITYFHAQSNTTTPSPTPYEGTLNQ